MPPRRNLHGPTCACALRTRLAFGEIDYAALHIVTMGSAVSEETARLFAANEYQPEQTTSAIICHHPEAKYFVAR